MGKNLLAVLAGVLLLVGMCALAQAEVYVYVDADGVSHFTDAPTKSYYKRIPAFGLPRGADLTRGPYADLINAISAEHKVDPLLVKAIIRAESNFDRRAVSKKGAQGLMQLMPDTAFRYAVRNPFDPEDNIRGGVQYLRGGGLQRRRERRAPPWRHPALCGDAGIRASRLAALWPGPGPARRDPR
jgi:soluble lytic murein transglycosylase-like protein